MTFLCFLILLYLSFFDIINGVRFNRKKKGRTRKPGGLTEIRQLRKQQIQQEFVETLSSDCPDCIIRGRGLLRFNIVNRDKEKNKKAKGWKNLLKYSLTSKNDINDVFYSTPYIDGFSPLMNSIQISIEPNQPVIVSKPNADNRAERALIIESAERAYRFQVNLKGIYYLCSAI